MLIKKVKVASLLKKKKMHFVSFKVSAGDALSRKSNPLFSPPKKKKKKVVSQTQIPIHHMHGEQLGKKNCRTS
jgi:hypothetical protein